MSKMTEKLIFVSCGQLKPEEKKLGASVTQLVDSIPGYNAYFAENVQSLDALARNIFDGLRRCSGLIIFFHERGRVTIQNNEEWGHRSSVWVNQEIAILAYRKQFEGMEIPILAFKEDIVLLEGAMTSLIVNPYPMVSESDVLERVGLWLNESKFPLDSTASDDWFYSKWPMLSPSSHKVITALIEGGGENVKEAAIRAFLQEKFGLNKENEASDAIRKARNEFIKTDLAKWERNIYSGDEMSINPTWQWHIAREINKSQ